MMERWGAFVARRALAILLAGIALVVAAGAYGFGVFDALAQGGFDDPDSESARELALERETFGNRTVDVVAIYSSEELTARSPEFRSEVEQTLADVPAESTSSVL
jgi:trehalose monomycolate/heme transporter